MMMATTTVYIKPLYIRLVQLLSATGLLKQGAWWGLLAGLVTGFTRMIVEFSYTSPNCGSGDEDIRPAIITNVHYLMFALILGAVCLVVTVAVTIITKPRRNEQVRRLRKHVSLVCL